MPLESTKNTPVYDTRIHLDNVLYLPAARGPGIHRQGPPRSSRGPHQHGGRQGFLYLDGKTPTHRERVGVRGAWRTPG